MFALGLAGFLGLLLGNFSMQKLPSSLVSGSQSWVLLAIPTFIFAGGLRERCGMPHDDEEPQGNPGAKRISGVGGKNVYASGASVRRDRAGAPGSDPKGK